MINSLEYNFLNSINVFPNNISGLVKKSSRRYMVAGESLSILLIRTMLAAQSIDGNSSLGTCIRIWILRDFLREGLMSTF